MRERINHNCLKKLQIWSITIAVAAMLFDACIHPENNGAKPPDVDSAQKEQIQRQQVVDSLRDRVREDFNSGSYKFRLRKLVRP